jgi:hypothetical protein
VDQVATNIPDPVARLRFLRAEGPAHLDRRRSRSRKLKRGLLLALVGGLVLVSFPPARDMARAGSRPAPRRSLAPAAAAQPKAGPDVWLVERSGEWETYSNGLRVDNHFVISTGARSYLAFPVHRPQTPERRTDPAGIVFHTTESHQAPFEAGQNNVLKSIGESLLEYVQRGRSYNFVIDRFGRVYRVVPEAQVAYHAGHSLWADENWAYLNLNDSFLGVSFEAETRQPAISPAQTRSGTMLIEMLRSRYPIDVADCATHAQVSVNPDNMRVGYHVDWAPGFPFEALGLPDNNALPLPALWQFGFESDETYRGAAGARLQAGIDAAEEKVIVSANAAGLKPAAYRELLRRNYRELLAKLYRPGLGDSTGPE